MKTAVLLLVLLCLPALSLAATCADTASNCADCETTAAGSACNYCKANFWKSSATACTACSTSTFRVQPSAAVQVETADVCEEWAPQLNCAVASSTYSCDSCPAGMYREQGGQLFGLFGANGCSSDCNTFNSVTATSRKLIPQAETPAPAVLQCVSCGTSGCTKCVFAEATMRATAQGTPGANKQLTKCTECIDGHYLLPNAADPTIVPTCARCGANCKKCKDNTQCDQCFPGWALEGTNKRSCTKKVPISSAGGIIPAAMLSLLALVISW